MKKQVFLIASLLGSVAVTAQTNSVGIGTAIPNSSAILDITSTSKGVLLPRVSLGSVTDGTAITTPATGLLVYNTNAAMPAGTGIFYNSGTPAAPLWARLPNVAGNSAPVVGETIIWNGTTYVTGYPAVAVATGTPLTGNGNAATPLTVNNKLPIYNADSLQGIKISSTAPANNQVLLYNASTTQYVPSAVPGDNWGTQSAVTSGAAISGNGLLATPLVVNNTLAIFNADSLRGTKVSTAAPVNGQSLVFNSTNNDYEPGTQTITTSGPAISGNGTSALPITVNNKLAIYNADSLQGIKISATAPINNQVLVYNSSTGQYAPATAPGDNWGTQTAVTSGAAISGNGLAGSPLVVNNTTALFNANSIQGTGVSTNAPVTGQVLVFNGSTYVPTSLSVSTSGPAISGNGVSSPLVVNNTLPIFNADSLQGIKISNATPTNGQVLIYNSSTSQYVPSAVPGDNWGTQVALVTGAVTGNGAPGSPLGVNNKLPIYNADSLQGIKISTTIPTNNQVLVYNSGTGQYVPATAPGDNWGTQSAVTSGAAISGNGLSATPLVVNNTLAIFNADSLRGTKISAAAPVNGQYLVFNSTNNDYEPGTQTVTTSGTAIGGNGTVASPITINNKLAIYNADSLQGIKISTTLPANNQVLSYVNGAYTPVTLIDSTTASNGVNLVANDLELGGTLTKNTDIPLNSKNLTFSGAGYVGIGTAAAGATNALDVKATADPVKLEGLQPVTSTVNYKAVVADPTGVLKTVTTLTKMIAASASDTQAINASSFNGGTAAVLSFTNNNILANTGGIFTFNDGTNEFTVSEAGTYIIEGWCGYVSNIDASNGANNNIGYGWGQGVNLDIDKNGTIMDGTRYIYTSEMGHISDIDFIATIYAKTILTLAAGDKITLALQKVLGNSSSAPNIIHPTGLPGSKKIMITRL